MDSNVFSIKYHSDWCACCWITVQRTMYGHTWLFPQFPSLSFEDVVVVFSFSMQDVEAMDWSNPCLKWDRVWPQERIEKFRKFWFNLLAANQSIHSNVPHRKKSWSNAPLEQSLSKAEGQKNFWWPWNDLHGTEFGVLASCYWLICSRNQVWTRLPQPIMEGIGAKKNCYLDG